MGRRKPGVRVTVTCIHCGCKFDRRRISKGGYRLTPIHSLRKVECPGSRQPSLEAKMQDSLDTIKGHG